MCPDCNLRELEEFKPNKWSVRCKICAYRVVEDYKTQYFNNKSLEVVNRILSFIRSN